MLASLNEGLDGSYGIAISDVQIAVEMRPEEIPNDAISLLKMLQALIDQEVPTGGYVRGRGDGPNASGEGTRVDWDARDESLATEVREAAEQICAITGRQRCTVAAICASVPELRAKLGALDQLPRTARAIRDATWPRRRRERGTLL